MSALATFLRIHCLAACALVSACTGGAILTVSNDLTRLQREKAALEAQIPTLKGNPRDAAIVQLANVEGELERVADASYASARQIGDTKARIANYRIAGTADWQRGDRRAIAITREGTDLCNSSGGYEVAPRDCVILLIIPDLLVNDILVMKFEEARSEAARGVSGVPAKYRSAVNDLLNSYIGLERVMTRAGTTDVSPLMISVVRSRRDTVARNIDRYIELFVTRGTPADRTENIAICADIRRDAPAILPRRCRALLS